MRYRWLWGVAAALCLAAALFWPRMSAPLQENSVDSAADLGLMLLEEQNGVSVLAVRDGSVAEGAGIRPTDLLVELNDTPCRTVDEMDALLRHADSVINIDIQRGGKPYAVQILLGPGRP